jgi:AGCS family alanine or glycine:cation symporter
MSYFDQDFIDWLIQLSNSLLFLPALLVLFAGLLISILTGFIQIRAIPTMCRLFVSTLSNRKQSTDVHSISPYRALLTSLSTTLGTMSIVAPMVAIKLGGPGAVAGFVISMFLGGAVSFTEVSLALRHRKKMEDGTIMGGPMQYLADKVHPWLAKWYAAATMVLLLVWCSNQANTVADLLDDFYIPDYVTGLVLAGLVFVALIGGIQRIGSISAKLVPVMFVIYLTSSLWIVFTHLGEVPRVFRMVFEACTGGEGMAVGAATGGIVQALRWGLLKGVSSNEAGVGTATIPHSKADIKCPVEQGVLSLVAIYSTGFISLISCFLTLLSGTWADPSVPVGVRTATATFAIYLPQIGPIILLICTLLFAYGTILGNNYNGSQCFGYLTRQRYIRLYHVFTCFVVFGGAVVNVQLIWVMSDFFLIPVLLPNIIGIIILSFKERGILTLKNLGKTEELMKLTDNPVD